MPYYSGDYYRGDYYKGDPGFLSTLGNIAGGLASFIPGVGGIVSKGIGMVTSALSRPTSSAGAGMGALPMPKGVPTMTRIGAGVGRVGTVLKAHPVLTAAGAAGIAGAAAGVGGARLAAHLGRGGRRHRRMRVTNPKALRRAIRRTQGFAKLAMRTIHLVHPQKHARFGGFRRRKRKRV